MSSLAIRLDLATYVVTNPEGAVYYIGDRDSAVAHIDGLVRNGVDPQRIHMRRT